MVYLATLSSSMVLTGTGAGNVLGESKGADEGRTARIWVADAAGKGRAAAALVSGRVVRDEYNLKRVK
jgi:hypothetical protein